MLGRALIRARMLGKYTRGCPVSVRTLAARQLRVDARADDGVYERQRTTGLENARRRQHVGGVGGLDLIELRESRSLDQFATLQHGYGACQTAGRRGEPVEAQPK